MSARAAWCALAFTWLALAALARADEFEPPPEAGEDDYVLEAADTLAEGAVETSFGASGHSGAAPVRGQRLRFRNSGTNGTFRDGGDPLAGGRLDAPVAGGRLHVGRLAPRWARGLVLGSSAEPWSARASDRGDDAAYRGRSGDGAAYMGERAGLEGLAGRFSRRDLCGARAAFGRTGLGVLTGAHTAQASAALEGESAGAEFACDARGRWRAESALREAFEWGDVDLRVRGGSSRFRSLAEPRRSGPSRAIAVTASRENERARLSAHGALWCFEPGVAGARGALEVHRSMVHHAQLLAGFEEQHGTRRDPLFAPGTVRPEGMRQGWWCEWRAVAAGRALALRHELWGEAAFARRALRRVLVARGSSPLPAGGELAVTHAVWSARSGEKLYLPEAGEDRLTLRALSGAGARTRVECELAALGGRVRSSVTWQDGTAKRVAPAWTLEWTRRTRL